ncbi:MAG: glutamine-hydrolyzing GMP synthase [Gammaproteobacteria bacterium]|nr:glutamine-hydrolyzing GMP synthase [Gammaproteobacteria bacterium]
MPVATGPQADIHAQRILILDFGSQYTQLIARRIRELGVFSEIHAFDIEPQRLREIAPSGIVLSGGPESVHESAHVRAPDLVFELGVPVLGICYGMQTMAAQMGARVAASAHREFGHAELSVAAGAPLLDGIADRYADHDEGQGDGQGENRGLGLLDVWMSHADRVEDLPPGFEVIASTGNAPIAAIADPERRFYGIQFHPEVTHTPQGGVILSRFVHEICGCANVWTPAAIIDDAVARIRETVGEEHVLLALSGGVDSSVVAALLNRAIGDRLVCVFVDNGLLRKDEGDQVMTTLAEGLGVNIQRVDAETRFLQALSGVDDPEQKRKRIGNLFIEIFEEAAGRLADIQWLAQGTIYPDVIESAGAATGKAHVIKSHHNVGGLPERMRLKLVEPVRELFKDEVRRIGLELGLPAELINRHPFPGPGLGVRILGEVCKPYADTLREADAIFIHELRAAGWYDKVSQAFAVYLPVRSVGVMGDMRRYEHVIALRAVETVDFMTARWAHLPYALIERVSNRIINEVAGVSRVVYDVSGKPPATIEWE